MANPNCYSCLHLCLIASVGHGVDLHVLWFVDSSFDHWNLYIWGRFLWLGQHCQRWLWLDAAVRKHSVWRHWATPRLQWIWWVKHLPSHSLCTLRVYLLAYVQGLYELIHHNYVVNWKIQIIWNRCMVMRRATWCSNTFSLPPPPPHPPPTQNNFANDSLRSKHMGSNASSPASLCGVPKWVDCWPAGLMVNFAQITFSHMDTNKALLSPLFLLAPIKSCKFRITPSTPPPPPFPSCKPQPSPKITFSPFIPKSDKHQISPAASPEILHDTIWRTWLFIAIHSLCRVNHSKSLWISGSYMYVEASELRANQTARLEGSALQGNTCLAFYYHMNGEDVGTLRVESRDLAADKTEVIWAREGQQGNAWKAELLQLTGYKYKVN